MGSSGSGAGQPAWDEIITRMPTRTDIDEIQELWPNDWREKNSFFAGQVATLLDEVERLRAREAALRAVVERVAVVDSAERIIPRAVIQQARAVLASAGESEQEGGGDGA